MLVKLNRSAQVSEAVGAAFIVGAGEETGHKFHFASTAVEGCSTQDYELLILSVEFIPTLLFFWGGNVATVVLPWHCVVGHSLLRTPSNQGTRSLQTTLGP